MSRYDYPTDDSRWKDHEPETWCHRCGGGADRRERVSPSDPVDTGCWCAPCLWCNQMVTPDAVTWPYCSIGCVQEVNRDDAQP